MTKGFKDFLMRGNVVDLAIAVVIGAAFTTVVTALTKGFIEPLIKLVGGGGELAGVWEVDGVEFLWAAFLNAVINFVIVAAVVYFLVVVPVNRLMEMRRQGEVAETTATPEDIALLQEIRDLLRAQSTHGGPL